VVSNRAPPVGEDDTVVSIGSTDSRASVRRVRYSPLPVYSKVNAKKPKTPTVTDGMTSPSEDHGSVTRRSTSATA